MKTRTGIFIKVFLFLTLVAMVTGVQAQDKATDIKKLLESKKFVFNVQTINPTSGITRQSISEYDLRISGDSLISYLPYFGRAFSASPGERGGFNFTSSKFDYVITPRKKGRWEISIRPKDVNDVREFSLSISEKGYATLRALSNNRQPISYTGYITAVK